MFFHFNYFLEIKQEKEGVFPTLPLLYVSRVFCSLRILLKKQTDIGPQKEDNLRARLSLV